MITKLRRLTSSFNITLLLICFSLLYSDYTYRLKGDQWKYAVNTDAYYYYRYLPSIFINHHLDSEKENPRVIKYFIGTPLMELPFFGMAYFTSYFANEPLDGYSKWFPIFISFATLFYLLWGIYFFGKFLRQFEVKEWIICTVSLSMVFCTNIFYYAVFAPGWCHIIAFGLVCFLLYHLKKIFIEFNKRSLIYIIVASSFLFFVRPTDAIVLLIAPFLAKDKSNLLDIVRRSIQEKKTIFVALLFAAIPAVCQLGIYKAHTDHFFVWSYTKEGFNFLKPEIVNVLFSYSKGFFVYAPICFLALFGFRNVYKQNTFLFGGILIYLLVNIYIISSWWCWNYGYSLGNRAFVEHLPIFFLLLAFLLSTKNIFVRILIILLIMFFGYVSVFQTFQSEHGILDKDYRTDAKGYWNVFLNNKRDNSGKYFRFPVEENKENVISRQEYFNDLERIDTAWINTSTGSDELAHSGKFSSKVNKDASFSIGMKKKFGEFPYNRNVLIRVSGWFYISQKGSNSFFAISFTNKGKSIDYCTYKMDGYMDNFGKWENKVFEIYMPKFSEEQEREKGNQIEFYLYNDSDKNCYVDDLKIEFIEFKHLDRLLDIDWER